MMNTTSTFFWKEALALTVSAVFLSVTGFIVAEPAVTGAQSASDQVTATLNVTEEITISDGANVTMSPDISLSQDTSVGSSAWTVETNATAGYTLAVKAGTDPAMQHNTTNDAFADYTPSTSNTPEAWSADSSSYQFGYGAYGTDAKSDFGNGSNCGSSDPASGDVYYEGASTTDEDIASRSTTTPSSGVTTNICFGAEQKGVNAPAGTYTATLTATATVN